MYACICVIKCDFSAKLNHKRIDNINFTWCIFGVIFWTEELSWKLVPCFWKWMYIKHNFRFCLVSQCAWKCPLLNALRTLNMTMMLINYINTHVFFLFLSPFFNFFSSQAQASHHITSSFNCTWIFDNLQSEYCITIGKCNDNSIGGSDGVARLCKQALINEQICVATGTKHSMADEKKTEKKNYSNSKIYQQQQYQHPIQIAVCVSMVVIFIIICLTWFYVISYFAAHSRFEWSETFCAKSTLTSMLMLLLLLTFTHGNGVIVYIHTNTQTRTLFLLHIYIPFCVVNVFGPE